MSTTFVTYQKHRRHLLFIKVAALFGVSWKLCQILQQQNTFTSLKTVYIRIGRSDFWQCWKIRLQHSYLCGASCKVEAQSKTFWLHLPNHRQPCTAQGKGLLVLVWEAANCNPIYWIGEQEEIFLIDCQSMNLFGSNWSKKNPLTFLCFFYVKHMCPCTHVGCGWTIRKCW